MTILHATVTQRRPAPPDPPDPAPFQHADALIKAATPDRFDGPIWPLNESDLDLPAPYRHSRECGNPEAALDAPHYLGSLTACQRGIPGPLSLDVMLSADGSAVEIGPFTLDRHNTHWLQRLVSIAVALTQPPPPPFAIEGRRHRGGLPPETGRNIAGWDLAEGLAEGETRP